MKYDPWALAGIILGNVTFILIIAGCAFALIQYFFNFPLWVAVLLSLLSGRIVLALCAR